MLSQAVQGHKSHLCSGAHQKGSMSEDTCSCAYTLHAGEEVSMTLQVKIQIKQCVNVDPPGLSFLQTGRGKRVYINTHKLAARLIIHISPSCIGWTSTATNTITHCSFLIHILLFLLQQSTTPFFPLPLFIQLVVSPVFFSLLAPLHLVLSKSCGTDSFSVVRFIREFLFF